MGSEDNSSKDGNVNACGGQDATEMEKGTETGAEDPRDAEIARLKTQLAEETDKYLRALADFENYKKRALKERSEFLKYQGEQIITDFLDVADNFERAVQHLDADSEQLKQGITLIYKLFADVFKKWGVQAVSGVDQEFDPSKFNALGRVPVADKKPGTIINELKKAYTYKDKVIRYGQVIVAEAKQPEEPPKEEAGELGSLD